MAEKKRKYFREDNFFNIPESGDIVPLKFLCLEYSKYGANEAAEEENPEDPRYIRITDIDEKGSLRNDTFKSLSLDIAESYLLQNGDVLFARSGATVGKTFLYKSIYGPAVYAGYLVKYRLDLTKCSSEFIYYCTKSKEFENWLKYTIIEATIENISGEKYANLPLPLPSLTQQNKIVDYLDNELSKIDALIETKTQLITILEEKKKAVINQAVTKGLDPNVLMKASGIEWLGEIPEHWEVVKLKYLVSKIDELNEFDVDLKIAVENIEGFSGKLIDLKNFNYEGSTSKFKINDIIFNKLRPYLGKVYLAEQEGGVYGELLVLRPLEELVPKFLFYTMISAKFINLVNSSTTGAKMPRASWDDFIKNIFIPIIPKEEQQTIVEYLDKTLIENSQLSIKLINSIELLKEKRTAIISAAVNGGLNTSLS
ncbi:restriction endonuclease subunit S [Chryseobacterium sp. EO14]|uniref:restriction endonuclease subunit S n=1 Tax=Chryseobacterium sp. EO14 TaxID=2950551 RepID=UPI00210CFA75|nr:restriction endonuclease subunit S [Chryseobacterium sp. EO14]MCQ4141594.1 restriction endonuclease subunit S [Chryseobacterium sp. EO14]